MSWPDEWADLSRGEPISDPQHIAPDLVEVSRNGRWCDVAKWASTHLPGLWFPRDYGCTWICGSRRLWLVERGCSPPMIEANRVAKGLGVKAGWSIGSCALALLKWIGEGQWPERSGLGLIEGLGWGYTECRPGRYDACILYDASSYYYTLWSKLPSLRVHVHPDGRLIWQRMTDQEEERREAVKHAVRCNKLLRNALVGCACGSVQGTRVYCRGEARLWKGSPGRYRNAALMVVRTGWELTRAAAEEVDAVYAHTDSVASVKGLYPSIWERAGVKVGIKATGDADVLGMGRYRIGVAATKWYREGAAFREATNRAEWPSRTFLGWAVA